MATNQIAGGHAFTDEGTFSGQVKGDASVSPGARLVLRGQIAGNLEVGAGATVEIEGQVVGTVINLGGQVTIRGMVGEVSDRGTTSTVIAKGAVILRP